MNCADINWMAGWVVLAIGVGLGMFIAAIMRGND